MTAMFFTFAVLVLGVARMTRLVTTDTILDGPRLRWFKRFHPAPFRGQPAHPLGQLVDCGWCVAWWGAGLAVLIACQFTSIPLPVFWWPAVAEAASLLIHWLDK